jgi:hypothetical protein
MKKKILIGLVILSCGLFELTACNKETTPTTEEIHNYATNDVEDKNSEDPTTEEETTAVQGTVLDANDLYGRQDTGEDEDVEAVQYDGITYVYPNTQNSEFYVNDIPVAQIAPYSFTLGDISVSENEIETLSDVCINNHIYCGGYGMKLDLTDEVYDTRYSEQSLSKFVPAIDTIRLGQKDVAPSDLFRSITNFPELVKFCNSNFTSRKTGNADDIFSYAVESKNNELWGTTYTWKFSLDDANLEYTADEISAINSKNANIANSSATDATEETDVAETTELYDGLDTELIITAAYNSNNKLAYYTFSVHKIAHFWTYEIMVPQVNDYVTDEVETVPIDKDGNEIPASELDKYDEDEVRYVERQVIEHREEKVPTGEFITQQNGFDFSYAYIKLKDGSSIGLDSFSFTMHEPSVNRSMNIDYEGF